jgi:biotin carboxyl carrier protein
MAEAAAAPTADGDVVRVEVNDRLFTVRVLDRPRAQGAQQRPAPPRPARAASRNGSATAHGSGNAVLAPMHGVVVEVGVEPGATVREGDVVAVIEAMKMMNEIRAHRAGTVGSVMVERGATVEAQSPLLTID